MDTVLLLCLPIVTALIGWLTNKLAIWMLFHPRKPRQALFWRWQGLAPRRQKEVASRVGEVVQRDILDKQALRREIAKVDLRPYMDEFAKRLVSRKVGQRLQSMPLIGSLVNDSALAMLEGIAAEEMHKEAPHLVNRVAAEFERHIDVKSLVEERIGGFDLDKLEEVVNQVARREFRSIELFGGLLGFFIGLAQMGVILLSRV